MSHNSAGEHHGPAGAGQEGRRWRGVAGAAGVAGGGAVRSTGWIHFPTDSSECFEDENVDGQLMMFSSLVHCCTMILVPLDT